jgi:hypothetical protein
MSEQQPPIGWIRMTVDGNGFTANMISPKITLNGYPVRAPYGESVHPVPPGPWKVEATCQWWRQYGQAALDVQVAEGQTVDVFYAPPWHQFTGGRMGTTRQRRPGGISLLTMAFVLLVLVAGIYASLT